MDQRTQYGDDIRYVSHLTIFTCFVSVWADVVQSYASSAAFASPQALASSEAYSSSNITPSTAAAASYAPAEAGVYGGPLYRQRQHAASFSTASGSSASYPPVYYRSYSAPDWNRTNRSAPESAIHQNGYSYAPLNATYPASTYYAQPGTSDACYGVPVSAYPRSTYAITPSLAALHTNGLPDQDPSLLSPLSATPTTVATYNGPQDSEPSVSPPSEDAPHE